MFSLSDEVSSASKAVFEANLQSATAFAQAAFDTSKSLIDLHVATAKASIDAAGEVRGKLLSIKDPQEFFSLTQDQSQQALERAREFGRQAAEIAQEGKNKFSQVAEVELANSKQKVGDFVEAVKKAPTDAGVPINTFFKGAFDRAQAGYEQFAKAGQKAGSDFQAAGETAARSLTTVG
jgi:phasin family protein